MKTKVMMAIGILLFLFACQKDEFLENQSPNLKETSSIVSIENEFFNLKVSNSVNDRDANFNSIIYHPFLLEVYNEIKDKNGQFSFVEDLSRTIGFPKWGASEVHFQGDSKSKIVRIPFTFPNSNEISGMLIATKLNGNFHFEGITRAEILQIEAGDPIYKLPFANAFLRAEQRIFKNTSEPIRDAYCSYGVKFEEGLVIGELVAAEPCEWQIIERCSDLDAQVDWIGGVTNAPVHLDHDQDGILNENDQDWYEFSQIIGASQSEFQQLVIDYWNENLQEEFGDYDDYWDNHYEDFVEDFYDYGGEDQYSIQDFWDDLQQIYNHLFEPEDPVIWGPPEGEDVDCPFPGGGKPDSGNWKEKNQIVCEWFYFKDCGPDDNWWNDFNNLIPCPECPNYEDYQDMFHDRLYDLYHGQYEQFFVANDITFNQLGQFAIDGDCDPFSPHFEECILEITEHFVSFANFLETHHIEIPIDYFINNVANCITSDYACFWEETKGELQLNFSYENLVSNVKPFLDENSIPLNELAWASVNYCALDNNFGDCYVTNLSSKHPEILGTLYYGEDVGLSTYFRCADIVFSEPYNDGIEYRTAQLDEWGYILALGCIPAIPEADGFFWQSLDVTLRVEAKFPDYLFSGPFGYADQQTKVAQFLSTALNQARELILVGLNCNNAVSKRASFRSFFKNYISDFGNKEAIWGQAAGDIQFRDQFFETPPNYTPVEGKPSLFESATICN